jgi:pimeloyl-ACP methyl ester carboxylesterase
MKPDVRNLFDLHLKRAYQGRAPLILVNGLAEQAESWFANKVAWSRHFDLKIPEFLVYDGEALHRHIDSGGEVTVDYLADRLASYLDEFVQKPPYRLVGSSLGCQVILTYAVRHPDRVKRIVLLGPSGFHGDENLPVMEGVRRSDYGSLVSSVFHSKRFATDDLVEGMAAKFQDRKWKKGVLRTLRGTVGHSVTDLLDQVVQPTLIVWGSEDRVIADVPGSIRAAERMLRVRQIVIPKCGHAPQIEKHRLVNGLVTRFMLDKLRSTTPPLTLDARRYLSEARTPARGARTPVRPVL